MSVKIKVIKGRSENVHVTVYRPFWKEFVQY
jgi:hypothetical protein